MAQYSQGNVTVSSLHRPTYGGEYDGDRLGPILTGKYDMAPYSQGNMTWPNTHREI